MFQKSSSLPDQAPRTHNPSPGLGLHILHLTDCHIYADPNGCLAGVNTQQTFDQVLQMARQEFWPADLLLATGDLVHDATPAGYNRLRERFEALRIPVHCLPGNHDIPETMNRCIQGGMVTTAKMFRHRNWLVILLDSTIRGYEQGRLERGELALLEQSLAQHPDLHVLISLHHHTTTVGSRWMDRMALENPDDFFRVIDRHHNVRGVLWGHIHQSFEQYRRGVRLMGTPSTCIQFTPRQDDFGIDPQAPGLRWMEMLPDGTIRSGIKRLAATPVELDLRSAGY